MAMQEHQDNLVQLGYRCVARDECRQFSGLVIFRTNQTRHMNISIFYFPLADNLLKYKTSVISAIQRSYHHTIVIHI